MNVKDQGIPKKRKSPTIKTGYLLIVIIALLVSIGAVGYFLAKPQPGPPEFEVSNLQVNHSQVEPGETVSISAEVTNVGDRKGTHLVELEIDGMVENSQIVTVSGGKTMKIYFTSQKETAGTYSVKIGSPSGSFRVITSFQILENRMNSSKLNGENYVWTSGIIKNNLSEPLIPQVNAKYYNEEELVVGTTNLGYGLIIPPHENFPFRTRNITVENVDMVKSYKLNSSSEKLDTKYLENIVVIGESVEENGIHGRCTIKIELQNQSNRAADLVYIQVAFYDEKGNLIGVGLTENSAIGVPPLNNLSATEKREIKIFCGKDHSKKPSAYKIFISGWT